MKKLLALFLLAALLLCMTACSRDEERDLSALEEYTSGELRALMGDAMEVADSRFDDIGPDLAEALVENMQQLGYPLEITSADDNVIYFALEDDPSVEFMVLHNMMWRLDIEGEVTPEFLMACLGSMAKALADEEGHPDAKDDVESYIRIFEEALPFELLGARQSCECYYDGYVYTVLRASDLSGYALFIE
ncbi:MAG TPA: hypothetical protein IAB50_05665 [Candidatus Faecivicinus avistercoris]|nr:hypothetical protein [Candidatus Faecivicinus avistercoris]